MSAIRTVIAAVISIAVLICLPACHAEDGAVMIKRIEHKRDMVQARAKQWLEEGRNPAPALALMGEAGKAFKSNNPARGEKFIDQAMQLLDASRAGSTQKTAMQSKLYDHPQQIEIAGYAQDAMEPCISLDGKYLFFNNSNELRDTHIFYARRLSPNKFQFVGLVPGTHLINNPSLGDGRELAPSLDQQNHFYYTSTSTYARDRRTLYVGTWTGSGVSKVEAVPGNISPSEIPWLNMDCAISPDGNTLLISRARMAKVAPSQSYLLIAKRGGDGKFSIDPHSNEILKNIQTQALQYAPAITADGLELYFTRCQGATVPTASMPQATLMQTMVARRRSTSEPFAAPERLVAIDGFAEAPSLTLDKKELFFHKRIDGRVGIFRLERTGSN